ncbi:hypothetical protein ACIOHS_27070 [Streptomyces sp. NPDC088253]|uniref:hypothetical protein n=1 Tax=Streptomyces sp. NPDC088253 TaxID=3365846 RepID=UPI0037F85C7E
MDATTALRFLTNRATSETEAAETARQNLKAACDIKGSRLSSLMEAAMVADAMARPWADLLVRIEKHGVREGLAKMRTKATEDLVVYGVSLSTSLVTNAERLHEQDGLRRFLSGIAGMDIEDDAPAAEEAAPTVEEEPAPAPTAVDVPKVTPAQRRTLEAIRDCGVEIQELRVGQARVSVQSGDRPRKDMVEWVIEQGWAARDHSTSLYAGQAVTLSEVGTAILAG